MAKIHICAFNADHYKARLEPLFPEHDISVGLSHDDLGDGISDCEVLIGFGPMLNDHVFARNKSLKWVQALGTGVDGIADRKDLADDVILTSMRGIHGPQMSEMAFMMMLALNRNFGRVLDNQKNKRWERRPPQVLEYKTIGILGVGLIAEVMAKRCQAFDMNVVGITGTPRDVPGFKEIRKKENLPQVVGDLDYLVVLSPMTPDNAKLVDEAVFKAMKKSAYLINLGRGGVVDDGALIDALKNDEIAGAGLDVFEQEPLPPDHPFWEMDNIIVTPHMAGMTETYVSQALPVIEANLKAYRDGEIENMVNLVRG